MWRPNALHIKGESLGNVHFAINYLQNPDVYHLGNRLIVIGAGNAAMDVCRTALRNGTRHVDCFSLSRKIAASDYEASYAKLEGVQFFYNKKPVEITDRGVVFRDLQEAEDGTLTEIAGSEKLYPTDSVIVSISQGPCTTITEDEKELKTNERGLFVTDEVGRTNVPVFLPAEMPSRAPAPWWRRWPTAKRWPKPCTNTCRRCRRKGLTPTQMCRWWPMTTATDI